jgi:hypothetical protein
MTKTRHLDNAIGILKGTAGAKRAPRTVQVTLTLTLGTSEHLLQKNGKLVSTIYGSTQSARDLAQRQLEAVLALGLTAKLEEF